MSYKKAITISTIALALLAGESSFISTYADTQSENIYSDNDSSNFQSTFYNSKKGILSGKQPTSTTKIEAYIDGNLFKEDFTITQDHFESNVSNDFYHEVKLGTHVITLKALNSKGQVLATTIITSDSFDKDPSLPEFSKVSYNKNKGIIEGNVPFGTQRLTVKIDGNTFNEDFIIEGSSFHSLVSDDFYHEAKFGTHNINVQALDENGSVLASSQIKI